MTVYLVSFIGFWSVCQVPTRIFACDRPYLAEFGLTYLHVYRKRHMGAAGTEDSWSLDRANENSLSLNRALAFQNIFNQCSTCNPLCILELGSTSWFEPWPGLFPDGQSWSLPQIATRYRF